MFIDTFTELCLQKKISVYKACTDIGLNRSAVAKWKVGGTPNGNTIAKMADYFGVSVGYLLGKEEQKEKPTAQGGELDQQLEGIEFALYGEVKDMTDAQKRDVLKFAQFLKQKEGD